MVFPDPSKDMDKIILNAVHVVDMNACIMRMNVTQMNEMMLI